MEKLTTQHSGENQEDDDVSVIAVIEKENDRSSMYVRIDESEFSRNRLQKDQRTIQVAGETLKMTLRKRSDSEPLLSAETEETEESAVDYKRVDILQKQSPEIPMKREKRYKDDSDYVKDSTETSSGGSTSGAPTTVRRVHRTTRRNRGIREIQKDPMHVTKKHLDKQFPRPRQQLLSAKRKGTFFDFELIKRGKSSTMPYMNTRSVTRKMYNVGATYQAPTIRDEMEWKEWPVHGMHERPIYHPRVGLATEYLGRCYTSIDGHSYHRVADSPEIEVVSVDPRCDFLSSAGEKKRNRKTKIAENSNHMRNSKTSLSSKKAKSFEKCMHESFHCVLGYCSQVMTPSYKTNVESKINKLNASKNSPNILRRSEQQSSMRNFMESAGKNKSFVISKENLRKTVEGNRVSNNYSATTMSRNVKIFNNTAKPQLFPIQKVYVANPQKPIVFANLKPLQNGQIKLQEVVQSSNNPLILVDTSEVNNTQIFKPLPNNMNLIKLEHVNDTLLDIPSVFNNAIPINDLSENSKVSSKHSPTNPTKRTSKVEFTVAKYLLDNAKQNKIQVAKETNTREEKKVSYDPTGKEVTLKASLSDQPNKIWCASDASEIAKILSEYNKSSMKKPAIENHGFYTDSKNIGTKEVSSKEEYAKRCDRENSSERGNVNIKFPQGKWRRFHLTVEKLKDTKGYSNERKTISKMSNSSRQSSFEDLKYSELSQKLQSSAISSEKKENSFANVMVNATTTKTQFLQELLENTAILYCAATGTHQDDLANYIDSLDASQSIQWLETCNDSIV